MGSSLARRTNCEMSGENASGSDRNTGYEDGRSDSRPLGIGPPRPRNDPDQPRLRPVADQPRQPANLQGLLRFAMEATGGEDAPHESRFQPLDEERKQFLNEALSGLTVNISEELRKLIDVLSSAAELRPDDDPSEYEEALDKIADYADNIDIANDFHKIGGFSIFQPCLNSPHSGLRWRVADIIAELAQNNPYCQEKVLEAGLMPTLLNMVDIDSSEQARIKALYAVSCVVRGHPVSLRHMDVNDGYSVLLRAMQSPVEKLQIKSAFLLSSLCNRDGNTDNLKSTLVKMGLVEQAAGLLAMGSLLPDTREQLLRVLGGLTRNNYLPALRECRRPELCLRLTLERHLGELSVEESFDEADVCRRLLDTIFAERETDRER